MCRFANDRTAVFGVTVTAAIIATRIVKEYWNG